MGGLRALRVTDKARESNNVTSLKLEPVDGRPLAAGLPGQFAVLRLRPSPHAPPLLRSYSLLGAPSEASYCISVKRNPGGVTGAYIADSVRPGEIIEMTAPRGAFTLQPGAGPVVLVSAGIGATPVLAMLHALAAAKSSREVWWLHGARNRGEHAFAAEVQAALKMLPRAHSHVRYSAPGCRRPAWCRFRRVGPSQRPRSRQAGYAAHADFYLCGPPVFMADFMTDLVNWGISSNRFHTEIFGTGAIPDPRYCSVAPKAPHPPTGPEGSGPLVSFARSGLNVRWGPPFQSLLELAEACDVPVRWACRTGVCYSCETALLTGSVGYQLDPVDPPAPDNVLIYCSQPRADVVIDL